MISEKDILFCWVCGSVVEYVDDRWEALVWIPIIAPKRVRARIVLTLNQNFLSLIFHWKNHMFQCKVGCTSTYWEWSSSCFQESEQPYHWVEHKALTAVVCPLRGMRLLRLPDQGGFLVLVSKLVIWTESLKCRGRLVLGLRMKSSMPHTCKLSIAELWPSLERIFQA